MYIVIGERLCDHLKKGEQTRKETEDQLALLLRKRNETDLVQVQLSWQLKVDMASSTVLHQVFHTTM